MSATPEDLELADRIDAFVAAHAKTAPGYDPKADAPEERFTGPDSALLASAAEALRAGLPVRSVWSSWSSGCYGPYGDRAARAEHDALVALVGARAR
jgi:hypothetical protein